MRPAMEPPSTNPLDESFEFVFVYGTLKRGHQRNHVLADQSFVGSATTTDDYQMYDLGDYPGLVEVELGYGVQVQGEIYRVDQNCLRLLDQIEAVEQGLYERRKIRFDPDVVTLGLPLMPPGDSVVAYFYLGDITGYSGCGDCW